MSERLMMNGPALDPSQDEAELRRRAIKRIEDKRGLAAHVLSYVLVNSMLVVIWYLTGADFFWPILPILGWGIGIVFHVWDVLWPTASERKIQEEMERMRSSNR